MLQAFDELLLLALGGHTIYCGPLGTNSSHLINYFQVSLAILAIMHMGHISCLGKPAHCQAFRGLGNPLETFLRLKYRSDALCTRAVQAIPGVPPFAKESRDGMGALDVAALNPATWVLDISTPASEERIGVDFADIYARSELAR